MGCGIEMLGCGVVGLTMEMLVEMGDDFRSGMTFARVLRAKSRGAAAQKTRGKVGWRARPPRVVLSNLTSRVAHGKPARSVEMFVYCVARCET